MVLAYSAERISATIPFLTGAMQHCAKYLNKFLRKKDDAKSAQTAMSARSSPYCVCKYQSLCAKKSFANCTEYKLPCGKAGSVVVFFWSKISRNGIKSGMLTNENTTYSMLHKTLSETRFRYFLTYLRMRKKAYTLVDG